MHLLFDKNKSTITRHIKKIYEEEELDKEGTVAKNATVQKEGKRSVERVIEYYNLDVIISVGYGVHSKRGIAFRKWATSILEKYMVQGYAINEQRLKNLNKTIEIQSKMLATALDSDSDEILRVVNQYTDALDLLDDYDHQTLSRPKGRKRARVLTYQESRELIDHMKFAGTSDVFGVEKEEGKLAGILLTINQTAYGSDVYPSLEEKAANLLYFLIKDHPFVDGCKRIGASLFLKYLDKNKALFKNGEERISNAALVAITLMIAESNPKEKEIMISLVMNFL